MRAVIAQASGEGDMTGQKVLFGFLFVCGATFVLLSHAFGF